MMEYSNSRFCYRCAYLEFKCNVFSQNFLNISYMTDYKYRTYKCFTFHVNICPSLQTDMYMNSFCNKITLY